MNLKQHIILSITAILFISLLLLSFFGNKGFFDLLELKREKHTLAENNFKVSEKNFVLSREVHRLKNDPEFIEDIARKELGVIGKNEIIFKPNRPGKGKND